MPKCLDCGNTKLFFHYYIDMDLVVYDEKGDNKIPEPYERYDEDSMPPNCAITGCASKNIDWNLHE